MATDLERREAKYDELTSKFINQRPTPLIAVYKIEDSYFDILKDSVINYMSRCLPSRKQMHNEEAILSEFMKLRNKEVFRGGKRDLIKSCTPNGLLVPKRHSQLEYNRVVQAYTSIIQKLNIREFIESFHIPLNVRYKDPQMAPENKGRGRSTETWHTDSWAGESPASITTMIPLLGDTDNNNVLFKVPPRDFKEEWIGFRESYNEGVNEIKNYNFQECRIPYKKGNLILADFATIHASSRKDGCGPRVSIDTTFAVKRSKEEQDMAEKKMHKWRKNERISSEELYNVGASKFFYFPDSENDFVESGGAKHPSNLHIINLESAVQGR